MKSTKEASKRIVPFAFKTSGETEYFDNELKNQSLAERKKFARRVVLRVIKKVREL
jgi:hypothetical protein